MFKLRGLGTRIFFIAALSALFAVGVSAQTKNAEIIKRVDEYFKNSGRTYRSTGTATWLVDTPKGKMMAAAGDTFVIAGFIMAVKADVPKGESALLKLLYLNHILNYSKVGTDDDGDLFLRAERHLTSIDQAAFNQMLSGLIADYDKVKNTLASSK